VILDLWMVTHVLERMRVRSKELQHLIGQAQHLYSEQIAQRVAPPPILNPHNTHTCDCQHARYCSRFHNPILMQAHQCRLTTEQI